MGIRNVRETSAGHILVDTRNSKGEHLAQKSQRIMKRISRKERAENSHGKVKMEK